jgi:hypothetical protein
MCEYSARDGGQPLAAKHTAIARYKSGEYKRPKDRTLQVLMAVLSEIVGRAVSGAEIGYPDEPAPEMETEQLESPLLAGAGFSTLLLDPIDPAYIDHLKMLLAERVRMDALTGPRYVLSTISGELSLIENLCGTK